MSTSMKNYAASLPFLYIMIDGASASPLPIALKRRAMTSGAQTGLGIGLAILAVAIIVGLTFFFLNRRRQAHNSSINRERAILAGEKNADGSAKYDKFGSDTPVEMPKRNKSVRDRLMGPLYRGSMIDMPPIPPKAKIGGSGLNRQSTMTIDGDSSWLNKPWGKSGTDNSPRPSFSSKRATRMMMMM